VLPSLLAMGSMWPCLLMQGRPFSNSLEAVLLALAMLVTFGYGNSGSGEDRMPSPSHPRPAPCR
jgi:hypothetical protein